METGDPWEILTIKSGPQVTKGWETLLQAQCYSIFLAQGDTY